MTRKLLIADDNPVVQRIHVKMLESALPYEILTAADGASALRIAQTETPDVILLDVNMPEMDGFTVMERIHADERLRQIRVIFLSGVSYTTEDKVRGLALGAYDYLTTPVQKDELIARVRVAFRLKEAEEQLVAERERAARLDGVLQAVRTFQHEVNNPLMALLGTLELLERRVEAADEQTASRLQRLKEAAERISDSIQRIGRVAKAETVESPAGDRLRLPASESGADERQF